MKTENTCVSKNGIDLTQLNAELQCISLWFRSKKLILLKYRKKLSLIFHRSRIKYDRKNTLKMDNCLLTKINSAKYLSVIIEHKLK